MSTVDCGEGRHDLCIGWGTESHLFPQRSGDKFECTCRCHSPESQALRRLQAGPE